MASTTPFVLGSALLGVVALTGCLGEPTVPRADAPAPVAVKEAINPITHVAHVKPVCPASMAHVGTSCVDKYEASLVEIGENGKEIGFSAYEAPNGKNVRAVSRAGVTPQAHISMVEAKRACQASGKRLCKAQEWKTACKGPEKTRYPYGDKRMANKCVDTGRTSPMERLHNGVRNMQTLNDPKANQMPNTVEPTGAAASCTNEYGVHDMVGNVHEWTDDGSFRGGYYLDTKLNYEGCDYRTTAHEPAYHDYSTGFRCCSDESSLDEDN